MTGVFLFFFPKCFSITFSSFVGNTLQWQTGGRAHIPKINPKHFVHSTFIFRETYSKDDTALSVFHTNIKFIMNSYFSLSSFRLYGAVFAVLILVKPFP